MTNREVATFAGGCFWCMVEPFDKRPGVYEVISGYTGGHVENPSYEQVASQTTGHVEAVQITFDPTKMPYEELVQTFWQQIDPTDATGQFNDRGEPYQTAIFYHNEEQKRIAEQSKEKLEKKVVNFPNQLEQKYFQPNLFIKRRKGIKIIIKKTGISL